MSQPFDLNQFPDLPPEVMKAFAAQSAALEAARFEASVERAARQHEQAVVAEKDAFITELKELIAKLEGQVGQYRHAKFGPKSEKLDPAQLELALEDLETAIAETQAQIAAVEEKIAARAADPDKAAPRAPRKVRALPEHLPRIERVIEPDSITCPCGCGDMVRIGEDRVERLDYIPARYQVIHWLAVHCAAMSREGAVPLPICSSAGNWLNRSGRTGASPIWLPVISTARTSSVRSSIPRWMLRQPLGTSLRDALPVSGLVAWDRHACGHAIRLRLRP